MNCMLRKFIIGQVNKVLEERKDSIDKTRETVKLWTDRTQKVLGCLQSILAKLEDNKIDDNEIEEAIEQLSSLVKGW